MRLVTVATDHRFADYRVTRIRLNYRSPRPVELSFLADSQHMFIADFSGEELATFESFAARCADCWLSIPEETQAEYDDLKAFIERTIFNHAPSPER